VNPLLSTRTFLTPARIVFGSGCSITATGDEVRSGRRKATIITSPSQQACADRLAGEMRGAGATVDILFVATGEPTIDSCEELRARTRALAPDLVVALGGGSVLDVAKLAAALHDRPEPITDFIGMGLVPGRRSALLCLPTTAGTGSEVSPNALLLDVAANAKKAVISPALVPDAAVVDPELMLSLPPAFTATTGIDALAHCLEAYASLAAHPIADLHALEGVRLIGANLARAVADGSDVEARAAVALGSLYGGMCLGPVNTNGVHALAYPLGGEYHMAHALAIALLLPHVVAFNCSALPERHAALARALDAPASGDDAIDAAALPGRLNDLISACGIPMGLENHAIPREALDHLAAAGMQVTRLLKNNPRVVSPEAARAIYHTAF
jgi:alcohol dehydrogenase